MPSRISIGSWKVRRIWWGYVARRTSPRLVCFCSDLHCAFFQAGPSRPSKSGCGNRRTTKAEPVRRFLRKALILSPESKVGVAPTANQS